MARLIFENITTDQAKALSSWFNGSGEQQCDEWLEMRGVDSPNADVGRKGGCDEVLPNGDVVLYLKTVEREKYEDD